MDHAGGPPHGHRRVRDDALKAVAGVLTMELGELQSAIQSSLELALLELYNKHKDKQLLH
jgi:hypothetical protein